ncbi:PEP-CTERM sorting domain-containing protein [Colwellia sp. 4_MG-2023]|uniref:PEP-CTERM sorting domain-containing protein n=1 Tax=unclassified Colwellia TaxID=196834 RepID=UPI0026E11498|nr:MULTISPECIES: PEP-CTERM sorting domain-containing protein [unclassified Colwellia]MDO6508644.1 PEP-CTERM sorting domain-containing protein [Colwellia sp. 5_MG-2023]MDO6557298.1 PEP-CTERM sorting domain-containing protein [Colwellia sp. 4_MG-2023]MDO6651510.1 PEP-CTERM sorting domain-containing protein [Colwellia sp. 3_MG-2023]MDO6667065.1 PEP-CTERM sorting domain-containing protein [Colwellia sp. 2_MG-2023]MDO6690915.1 PEP-CTERM sorting domain-containing protein [Colwellia sp. 1_MG-2023]
MKFKILNTVVAGLIVLVSGAANAGIINWSEVQNTTDFNDVFNLGTTVEAINATTTNSGSVTVNGVEFDNSTSLLSRRGFVGALDGSSTDDSGYDAFLNSFDFGNGSDLTALTIGGGNLIEGVAYSIQLWLTDLRPQSREMYFDDSNGNSSTLNAKGNGLGQYVIGEFTATGNTQELRLDALNSSNAHITGYQIRLSAPAATTVSEPSTLAIVALGLMGFASRRFKKKS